METKTVIITILCVLFSTSAFAEKKIVVDTKSNTQQIADLTQAELVQRNKDAQVWEKFMSDLEKQKAKEKADKEKLVTKLKSLGLTDDEISVIVKPCAGDNC